MKQTYDLSSAVWRLTGWAPYLWQFSVGDNVGPPAVPDVPPVPANVPGSVQAALLGAGRLPDWNVGLDALQCEWVENRHWMYETELPSVDTPAGSRIVLDCRGLDYSGWVMVDGQIAGEFTGSLVPHSFDVTSYFVAGGAHRLSVIFDCPPRWLGQYGYTSRMTEWKPRFNYTWDWTSRLVQIGIWDAIALQVSDGDEIGALKCLAEANLSDATGTLHLQAEILGQRGRTVQIRVEREGEIAHSAEVSAEQIRQGLTLDHLPVSFWFPNGSGAQPLYTLQCRLLDAGGQELDSAERPVGFKHVAWTACAGAPAEADPWICVVNGSPVFMQGVNWTPVRPNFADVSIDDYRSRLELYREIGCNLLRVWGGAFLEKQCFYDLCDELGLLVWQEFPLSSSGVENWPPEDERSIGELADIARSYIRRRRHHVSLTLWCGGNELQGGLDGSKIGIGKPVDFSHPLIARFQEVAREEDPGRRFLPTSASGPRFLATEEEFGLGLHWDVHGPWKASGTLEENGEWARFWRGDDALFRSETGAPGASSADLIRAYAGDCPVLPCSIDNPLWRRVPWWVEWDEFTAEHGRDAATLEEYVEWSQQRQASALAMAAVACKARFPRCGGFLVWMGHDSFPCTANTAIVDFWGRPKPAALRLKDVFGGTTGSSSSAEGIVAS